MVNGKCWNRRSANFKEQSSKIKVGIAGGDGMVVLE
jgi:hypothetical protein